MIRQVRSPVSRHVIELWLDGEAAKAATLDVPVPARRVACTPDGRRVVAAVGASLIVWDRAE